MALIIATYTTPEVGTLFGCWQQWMAAMCERDPATAYRLEVLRGEVGNQNNNVSRLLHSLMLDRVERMAAFLAEAHRTGVNASVLFTGIDVMPLRPYSLLASAAAATRAEIVFMEEPSPTLIEYFPLANTLGRKLFPLILSV